MSSCGCKGPYRPKPFQKGWEMYVPHEPKARAKVPAKSRNSYGMKTTGVKQRAVLELLRERERITVAEVARTVYRVERITSTVRSLIFNLVNLDLVRSVSHGVYELTERGKMASGGFVS